jgi:hypothetical protein
MRLPLLRLLACVLLMGAVHAQAQPAAALDTLRPLSLETCGTTVVLLRSPFGFVFGTNTLGDREKNQRLDLPVPGNGFVTAARVFWGAKTQALASGSVRLTARSVNADGSPGSVLRSSDTILVASLDTTLGYTWFLFPEPAAFTDRVFIGLDLRLLQPGDSLGVLGTEDGCGSGCLPWERWADGTWNPICDTYDLDDVDFWVEAAVDWTPRVVGLADADSGAGGLRPKADDLSVWPNPVGDWLVLDWPGGATAPWQWSVHGLDGRILASGHVQAGQTQVHMEPNPLWPAAAWRIAVQGPYGRASRLVWNRGFVAH